MAQNRWINITIDAGSTSRVDHSVDKHSQSLGASAAGDLTLSFDTAKFPSLSLLRSAVNSALAQAAGSLTP